MSEKHGKKPIVDIRWLQTAEREPKTSYDIPLGKQPKLRARDHKNSLINRVIVKMYCDSCSTIWSISAWSWKTTDKRSRTWFDDRVDSINELEEENQSTIAWYLMINRERFQWFAHSLSHRFVLQCSYFSGEFPIFVVSRSTLMTRDITSLKSAVSRQAENQQRSYDEHFIQSEREGSTLRIASQV